MFDLFLNDFNMKKKENFTPSLVTICCDIHQAFVQKLI